MGLKADGRTEPEAIAVQNLDRRSGRNMGLVLDDLPAADAPQLEGDRGTSRPPAGMRGGGGRVPAKEQRGDEEESMRGGGGDQGGRMRWSGKGEEGLGEPMKGLGVAQSE